MMATVFSGCKRNHADFEFLSKGETINADRRVETLDELEFDSSGDMDCAQEIKKLRQTRIPHSARKKPRLG